MANNAIAVDTNAKYGVATNYPEIDALSSLTIETWVKNQGSSTPYSGIVVLYPNDTESNSYAYLSTENGTGNEGINWGVAYDGANWADGYTASSYLTVGTWVHIALVLNGTTKVPRVYINGSEISYNLQETGAGNQKAHTTTDIYIGSSSSNIGSIGGFTRIWNVPRTQQQIINNKDFLLKSQREVGLIANFNFLEGSGTVIANEYAFGNVCNLQGSPSWVTGPTVTPKSYPNLNGLRPHAFSPGIAR